MTKIGKTPEISLTIPKKLRESVRSSNWDAVIVLGVENTHYWSGAFVPDNRHYLDRSHIVVWPRESEPIYIVGEELIDGIRARSFISRFVGYAERGVLPPGVIVDTLADVLRSEGLEKGLIGLEMLRTSVPFYTSLCRLLPDAIFEPADEMLRRLRMIKTPEEIEIMCTAAQWTEDSIWQALQTVKAGDTETDLAAKIQLNVLGKGCSSIPSLWLGAGEGATALFPPTNRQLKVGDMVRIDINALYRGYYCDMGRMAVVGEPSPEQTKAYEDHFEHKSRIIEFMRPGRTCSEVHDFYLEQANLLNLKLFVYTYIGAGHGIGVNPDEYPKLNAGDHTILEPGMIINLEPDARGPKGEIMHVEDMLLVTTNGVEVITSKMHDWSELPVINV